MPFGVKLKSLKNFGNKITAGATKFGNRLASGIDVVKDVAKDAINDTIAQEKMFNNVLGKVADISNMVAPAVALGLSANPVTAPLGGLVMTGNLALQKGQDAYAKGRNIVKRGVENVKQSPFTAGSQIRQTVGELQNLGQATNRNLSALGRQAQQDLNNAVISIGDEIVAQGKQATSGLQRQ